MQLQCDGKESALNPSCPVFPKTRLTSECAISHCLRFASEHWDAEPIDIDVGSKSDDSEGKEYCELEKDPGLRSRSSFMPLLLNILAEISAAYLCGVRLFVRHPLGHLLKRFETRKCVKPTRPMGAGSTNDCRCQGQGHVPFT
jgi:hypothetical protein